MNYRPSLTELAQQFVGQALKPGAMAIDATVGNGHDTLYLAQQVGKTGQVFGFDVQQSALDHTRQRLREHQLETVAHLFHVGHEQLLNTLPTAVPGRIDAAMFNLGYLPGSNKRVVTQPRSTLAALNQTVMSLRPGGLLSVLAYRGHAGGKEEYRAILDWVTGQAMIEWETTESPGPALFRIQRRRSE